MSNGIFTKKSLELESNQIEFAICSDIHIASDDGRNDYVFTDEYKPLSGEAYMLDQFCTQIEISGNNGAFYDGKHKLILLGDVINGENGYFNCYNSKAYKRLLKSIGQWLNTENIIYVAGNHDKSAKFYSTVAKFPKQSVVETIEEGSRKDKLFTKGGIIFEHGHKFDCLCTGKNLLGLMGDFASDVAVNLCSPDMEDLFRGRRFYIDHSADNEIRTVPKDTRIKSMNSECRRVANGALKLLSKHSDECHTIICGHTHQNPVKAVVNDNGKRLVYINTGKFCRDGYLNIVTEQDENGKWHLVE